jgi:hypothetical protein
MVSPRVTINTVPVTHEYRTRVITGTGAVWEIPTRGIPVTNPNTKSREMSTQLAQGCPKSDCGDMLEWRCCEAQIYRFVIKEDGVEYSNWEHIGYHDSHPRPPTGRKLLARLNGPYSMNTNTQLSGGKITTTTATRSFVSV